MERWTNEQRAAIVEFYFVNGRSIVKAQTEFSRKFAIRIVPTKAAIYRWINAFRETGSVADANRSGRPRSARTTQNLQRLRMLMTSDRYLSTRHASQIIGCSQTTAYRMLTQDLSLHAYKIQLVQALQPQDYESRLNFARRFLTLLQADPSVLGNMVMSDEAHFHLCGAVNRQNCRIWATESPRQTQQLPLHSPKITVWCGIHAGGIIGPYFFENSDGNTVSVNAQRYREMIRTFLIPAIDEFWPSRSIPWFQQDGATAHTSSETLELLRSIFPGKLISRFGDILWPSRSPDLTAPDYFLWGYLKERVYSTNPRTLNDLKQNIADEIAHIPEDMTKSVMLNLIHRLAECIRQDGGHLVDVVFRT